MNFPRSSGILLHITSLPSPYGIGDLGPGAYQFADFLAETQQRIWQVLPLVPVGHGYSPYSSPSTFAGNPLLISPDRLLEDGFLEDEDLGEVPELPETWVDYEQVMPFKRTLLVRAFERFEAHSHRAADGFERYGEAHRTWLDDYALFMALKEAHSGTAWTDWPPEVALREPEALAAARRRHAREIRMHKFWQYLFARQWADLRQYCRERDIRIFGDLPIYVAHDSADVWSDQELFYLDEGGHPTFVAGVPPDYFSETGQRWGNPIYRWDLMQEHGYDWWTRRLASILEFVDIVRLDHFRGFEAYWEIPAGEPTAVNGRWVKGPGASLFHTIREKLGALPIVAEDLGLITPEVTALMEQFGFPGMAVLQFAFGAGPTSSYLPHNFQRNLVAYTGTHDNDATLGWWQHQATPEEQAFARTYLDLDRAGEDELHWICIRALMGSVARLVVTPLQDVLGLGSEARMNTPGEAEGNWGWRFTAEMLAEADAGRLRHFTEIYGRAIETEVAAEAVQDATTAP